MATTPIAAPAKPAVSRNLATQPAFSSQSGKTTVDGLSQVGDKTIASHSGAASPINPTNHDTVAHIRTKNIEATLTQDNMHTQDGIRTVKNLELKAVHQGKVVYSRVENNLREMIRLGLVNFLPLFAAMKLPLSFTVLGAITAIFAGFVVRLANKLGQRVGRHVDPANLTPILKGFHKLHDVLNPSMTAQEIERFRKASPDLKKAILQEFQNRDHTDKVNRVLSDLAASSKLPKLLSFIRQERFQKWASEQFRFNPKSWVGRTLNQSINNKTLMKNQALSDFANNRTFMGAMGSGVRHVGNGFITFRVMPKLGRMIEGIADSPLCPSFMKPLFRWLGTAFKNAFIAQSAWDVTRMYASSKNGRA